MRPSDHVRRGGPEDLGLLEPLVGYGLAHVRRAGETWAADTWVMGPRIGEIELPAVLQDHRGRGLGTQLLDRLERELRVQGVTDFVIGVLPGCGQRRRIAAVRARGYRPTWMYDAQLDLLDTLSRDRWEEHRGSRAAGCLLAG